MLMVKGGSKKAAEIRYKLVQKHIQKPVQEIVANPEKENEKVQGGNVNGMENMHKNSQNSRQGTTVNPIKVKEKDQDRIKNRMTPNSKGKVYNEEKKKNGTGSSKGWSLSPKNKEALKLSA
ncbi:hypothetical protein Tco_0942962, partial [Tanacetum coccineum]